MNETRRTFFKTLGGGVLLGTSTLAMPEEVQAFFRRRGVTVAPASPSPQPGALQRRALREVLGPVTIGFPVIYDGNGANKGNPLEIQSPDYGTGVGLQFYMWGLSESGSVPLENGCVLLHDSDPPYLQYQAGSSQRVTAGDALAWVIRVWNVPENSEFRFKIKHGTGETGLSACYCKMLKLE